MGFPERCRFLWDRGQLLVFRSILRVADLLVLVVRPRLLFAYLTLFWIELRHSPYTWPRSFRSVLARRRTGQGARELVYGETPVITALWLFARAQVGRDSTLVDLSAGRGRPLLAARWLGAEARGLEILEEHVRLVAAPLGRVGIAMHAGDGASADLRGATHLFITWTGLAPAIRQRFLANARRCPPGTRLIAVDLPIEDDEAWELISHHDPLFSWGPVPVWIYELRKARGDATWAAVP